MAYYRRRGCKCKNKKQCTCGAKWSYTVDLGIDPITNKRKQKTKTGFNTKKEAQLAAAEIEQQVNEKTYVTVTEKTLNHIIDEWIEVYAKNKMKPSTFENKNMIIRNKIRPILGNKKIKDIEPSEIQSIYNKMLNDEGLSTSYARAVHNILSSVFKYAKKWDKIKVNIMEKVDAPVPKYKQIQTWSLEEVTKFMEIAKDYQTYIAYVLAIYTGMRMGEILGLRWKDIDLDNGTIHIVQAMIRMGGSYYFDEPKTKGAKRQISITDDVIEALKEHKNDQEYSSELVVTTSIGTPYSQRNLLRNFNSIQKRADVPKITFHDLRHTHATMLLKLGENPKIVSERLGHARTSITLDIYSHVLPDMQKETAQNFSNYLRGQNVVKKEK
ncbi:site-specific integrase [Lentibacillus salicampi]|uniref:Site-specific integrase n=1 Tax=Lentibacillus salicampi TaxID=175306 RepID=A0A4Y9ADZ2_9BACI|nr:site-specific integrase [Lentibacillus salicampi]TFJ93635.1 site-specific integrase [Lentibacillus salicampi]